MTESENKAIIIRGTARSLQANTIPRINTLLLRKKDSASSFQKNKQKLDIEFARVHDEMTRLQNLYGGILKDCTKAKEKLDESYQKPKGIDYMSGYARKGLWVHLCSFRCSWKNCHTLKIACLIISSASFSQERLIYLHSNPYNMTQLYLQKVKEGHSLFIYLFIFLIPVGQKDWNKFKERFDHVSRKLHMNHNEYMLLICALNERQKHKETSLIPHLLESIQDIEERYIIPW